MKKEYIEAIYLIICGVIIGILLLTFFLIVLPAEEEYERRQRDLYEEWCPKLNSTFKTPENYSGYRQSCIKENDNVVKFFFIANISGEYKLKEKR